MWGSPATHTVHVQDSHLARVYAAGRTLTQTHTTHTQAPVLPTQAAVAYATAEGALLALEPGDPGGLGWIDWALGRRGAEWEVTPLSPNRSLSPRKRDGGLCCMYRGSAGEGPYGCGVVRCDGLVRISQPFRSVF